MAMSTGGSQSVRAEPNVTPMIDVMLVLLIIFMLVIPSISAGFQAVPPSGTNLKPRPEEDTDQVLGIDANGQYFLNKRAIRNPELGAQLNGIYSARQVDKILFVKADRNLEYSKVIDALDVAAKNGVRMTAMITDQRPGTTSTVKSDNLLLSPAAGKPGGKK